MPPQGNVARNAEHFVEFDCYRISGTQIECVVPQGNRTKKIKCTESSPQNCFFGWNFSKIINLLPVDNSIFGKYRIKSKDNENSNVVCEKNILEDGTIISKNFKSKTSNRLTQDWRYESYLPNFKCIEKIWNLLLNSEKIKSKTDENYDSVHGNVAFENDYELNDNSTFIWFEFSGEFVKSDNSNGKLINVNHGEICLSLQNINDICKEMLNVFFVEKMRRKILKNNFELNKKLTNRLKYKWTIKNFSYYFNDPSVMYLESMREKLTTDGKRFEFYFCLYHHDCYKENGKNVFNDGGNDDMIEIDRNGENGKFAKRDINGGNCEKFGIFENNENCENDISLWINFDEKFSKTENTKTLVLFTVSIMDYNGFLHHTKVCQIYCDQKSMTKKWEQYISLEFLKQFKNDLLDDDKLTIYFEIETIEYGDESVGESTNEFVENCDNLANSVVQSSCAETLPKSVHTTTCVIKHSHTWNLSDFQKYLYEHLTVDDTFQDHLTSNSFSPLIRDDIKFRLNLSRSKIQSDCDGKIASNVEQISIFLSCENEQNRYGGLVQFRISLIDRTELKCNSKKAIVKYDSKNCKHGFENFIQTNYLFANSEQLLANDKLTIFCEIFTITNWSDQETQEIQMKDPYVIEDFKKSEWKSKLLSNSTSESKSHTKLQVYRGSHQWTIGEFSQLQSPNPFRPFYIDFPKFKSPEYDKIDFALRLYPKNDKLLKMCLFVNSREILDAIVLFDLSLVAKNEEKTNTKVGQIKISNGNEIEWSEFEMNRNDIFNPQNEFLNDDELVIYSRIKICLNPITEKVKCPENRILKKFTHYFDTQQISDITLNFSNGCKLYCHKEILVKQSPVFDAMFRNDFKENIANQVTFEDKDDCPEVFGELLYYFYTGKINKLEQFALEYIAIADKYLILELKQFVESWLMKNITIDSMIHILILADICDAPKLKFEAKRFIHRNASEIVNSELFQRLIREKPHLISELYFDSVLGVNKNIF